MRHEILVIIFIQAHKEKEYLFYVAVLNEFPRLFIALDHGNYARWASIHIRDMESLPD